MWLNSLNWLNVLFFAVTGIGGISFDRHIVGEFMCLRRGLAPFPWIRNQSPSPISGMATETNTTTGATRKLPFPDVRHTRNTFVQPTLVTASSAKVAVNRTNMPR
jgi:hypothetical protein